MPKEIKKVRGTARIYDDDSLGFTPQKEGNPVQNDVKKCVGARLPPMGEANCMRVL